MDERDRQRLVEQLIGARALSRAESESYLSRALDPDYWRRLCPGLSVGADRSPATLEGLALDASRTEAQLTKLRKEGYFQTEPVLDPGVVSRMRAAVETLRSEQWPAVFAYVFDEFWQVVRTPSLTRLVEGFFGQGYLQKSVVWVFYVAPVKGAQGWPPHSDSEGTSRLTVWVPLTDATVENGCMYVIPRDRLAADFRAFDKITSVTRMELSQLLQSTRALPSPAGAYLGWDHQLIHWGSTASGQTEPRVSLAVEFIARSTTPRPDEPPLFDPLVSPPFVDRVRAIGKSLVEYHTVEPSKARYAELGRLLADASA